MITQLFPDKLVRQTSIISFILLIISFISIIIALPHLQPFVPLYNQATWGPLRLVNKYMFFLPVGIVFSYTLINIFLAKYSHTTMPLVGRLLAIIAALSALLVCIFLIRTFQLII